MEGYLSDSCYPEENWTVTEIVVAAAPAILGSVSRELEIEPSALASFVPGQGTFEQQPEIAVAVVATATSAIAAVIFPVVVFPLIPVAGQLNLG